MQQHSCFKNVSSSAATTLDRIIHSRDIFDEMSRNIIQIYCVLHYRERKRKSLKQSLRQSLDNLLLFLPIFSFLQLDYIFNSRLIKFENNVIRLISLNAFISTLGGGYFVCKRLDVARGIKEKLPLN